MARFRVIAIAVTVSAIGFPLASFGFSGEDVRRGDPWHHKDITERALKGEKPYRKTGFATAASGIAWTADNIDSYLYNPLFWAPGGRDRIRAALIGYSELAKLHFDDTFTTAGLRATWQRYAAGTIAGLYWASLQGSTGDLAAGQHILGVSLHAVQDFYSHTNWVDDPGRRCRTFHQTPVEQRNVPSLYSGAYELPRSGAPRHHGAFSLSCSLLRGETMDEVLDPICSGYSPFQNLGPCEDWRVCREGSDVTVSVEGAEKTGWVYMQPPGMALDNIWLSRIQARNRGLVDETGKTFLDGAGGTHLDRADCRRIVNAAGSRKVCDLDSDMIFSVGKDLAIRTSIEWLDYLGKVFPRIGPRQARFWAALKGYSASPTAAAEQFEDLSQLPYQFLSAGPYPVANPSTAEREIAGDANGWYLRLRMKTADQALAGTDSDIKAIVTINGQRQAPILLDYLRTDERGGRVTNPLLVYNDFEAGAETAYTIGPFSALPTAIAFHNDSGSGAETLSAIWSDFQNVLTQGVTGARRSLLALIGGNTDYVGSDFGYYDYDELDRFFRTSVERGSFRTKTLTVDGGDEGKHRLTLRFRPIANAISPAERAQGWLGFEVQLHKLKTLKESKNDRGSFSDEPFVVMHFAPLNGMPDSASTFLSEVLDDMDDGDEHVFPRRTGSARIVKIPPAGGLVVSAQVWESDNENAYDRNQLRVTFESGFDEETRQASARFLDELLRMLAADWTLEEFDVFAFERGAIPQAGPVRSATPVGEIEGDTTSRSFRLDHTSVRPLLGSGNGIDQWLAEPVDARVLKGDWVASGLTCEGASTGGEAILSVADDAVNATLNNGDGCIAAGGPLLSGAFNRDIFSGTLFTPPKPKPEDVAERSAETSQNPLDRKPNYHDPRIDPNLDLEGNWTIRWENTNAGTLTGKAVLKRGAGYACLGENGCWPQFYRDPNVGWDVNFRLADGSTSGGSVLINPDRSYAIKYNYFHLGHWGGESSGIAGQDSIRGEWSYNNSGPEIWERVPSRVTDVLSWADGEAVTKPVGQPLTIKVPYSGPGTDMRGNRPAFYLQLRGQELWGLHYFWMPRSTGVEIGGIDYICAGENPTYPVHSNSFVCMDSGGVLGVQMRLVVWAGAKTGRYEIHFDDQVIPFNLVVTGHPDGEALAQPAQTERPIELGLRTCSLLEEMNPPNQTQRLVLRRSGSFSQ